MPSAQYRPAQRPSLHVMVGNLVAGCSLRAVIFRHDGQQQVLPVGLHPAVSGDGFKKDEFKTAKGLKCMQCFGPASALGF